MCRESFAVTRIGSDKGIGKYTFVGSTGHSVIDYVIATPSLLNVIRTFHVGEPNILSDHCLIDFMTCKMSNGPVVAGETLTFEKLSKKYAWSGARNSEYVANLEEEANSFINLNTHLTQITNFEQLDENLNKFTLLMEKVFDPLFSKNVNLMKKTGIRITDQNSHGLATNVADFESISMRL